MYDIHCHLVYGLDECTFLLEDSLKVCRTAAKYGVKGITATPHYTDGMEGALVSDINRRIKLLNKALEDEGIDIEVFPGMEVKAGKNTHELYEKGKVITLNNKKYMLVEFPGNKSLPSYIENLIFNLELMGVRPVIAHPERCMMVVKDPDLVLRLIDRDCIIQVDSGSIEGFYGREIQKAVWTLLKRNMVHVVASNNSKYEDIILFKKSYESVLKRLGERPAHILFFKNPYRIINGQDIFNGEPLP